MGLGKLLDSEAWAIERIKIGEEADFSAIVDKHFRAEILRRIMLCLPIPDYATGLPLTGMGVRLKGAIVTGPLNLEHGALKNGEDMPRLSLEGCLIKDRITLKAARLRRLCLKDARLSEMLGDHIHISGLLDIRGIKSHSKNGHATDAQQDLCQIRLCGAHIEDGIEAGQAHLIAPPFDEDYRKYSSRAPYALDLAEARINGDIRLFPDFAAIGGVNLNGAIIGGSVQAHGAHMSAVQLYAMDVSGAVIHGSLALNSRIVSPAEHAQGMHQGKKLPGAKRFVCDGQLRLNNVVIDEDLRLNGARIIGENGYISADHITVGGDANFCAFDNGRSETPINPGHPPLFAVDIFSFFCKGHIDLRGAIIRGDLNFKGSILGGDITTPGSDLDGELDISASQIGGHLLFSPAAHLEKARNHRDRDHTLVQRFISGNRIKLDGTKVVGNLDMRGAHLRGELQAFGLYVGGFANLAPYIPHPHPKVQAQPSSRFKCLGRIILDKATISQKLDMSGACLKKDFLAPNLTVGGKLLMCAFAEADKSEFLWFEAHERLNLSGANIESDFDLTGACLHKGLRFRGGVVKSALIFDIYNKPDETITPSQRYSIDLLNAHANIVSDIHYTYRNKQIESLRLGYDEGFFLRLEGFSYTRFPHYADEESLADDERNRRRDILSHLTMALKTSPYAHLHALEHKPSGRYLFDSDGQTIGPDKELTTSLQENHFDLRRRWLKLQFRGIHTKNNERKPTAASYNPDADNRLYTYYKRMGAQSRADDILRKKLHVERRLSGAALRILLWPIEKFFGFGLLPVRAFVVFMLYWSIVTTVVIWANQPENYTLHGKSLKDISFQYEKVEPGRFKVLDPPQISNDPPPSKTAAVSCDHKQGIAEALSYSLELIVPTLNLQQRKYCDFTTSSAPGWLIFKLLATIFGWIATPMLALTWSGLLRRNLEP